MINLALALIGLIGFGTRVVVDAASMNGPIRLAMPDDDGVPTGPPEPMPPVGEGGEGGTGGGGAGAPGVLNFDLLADILSDRLDIATLRSDIQTNKDKIATNKASIAALKAKMIHCESGLVVLSRGVAKTINFSSAFTAKPAFMAGMTRFEQEHDVRMVSPTVTSSSATITCHVEGSASGHWEAMWIACGH